jgi:hypothetical protein
MGDSNKDIEEPIEATMTTYGYILPYPKQNRFAVWFTGGDLEIVDDMAKCNGLFDGVGVRSYSERTKLFLARGFDERPDGCQQQTFVPDDTPHCR